MIFQPLGVVPPVVTPLTTEEGINEGGLRTLINHVINGGCHGVFVLGTTGEFYGFTVEEKKRIIQVSVEETAGRIPVYAGTAGITTRECIELTQIAQENGVDAISILTPMFIRPTQEELYQHFKTIAESTNLPVVLYNNLPKTGVTISPATVERLAEIPNIVGIKDSTGDFSLTVEYIRRTRKKEFHVLAGRDTLIHACLCHGGKGSIAACANIVPRLVADIYDKYVTGDVAGSLEAQFKLAPLRMAFSLGSFPTVIKEGLELIGIEVGPCMRPVGRMSTEEKRELKKILIELGVI